MEGLSVLSNSVSSRPPLKNCDMSLNGFKWQAVAERGAPLNRAGGRPIMGLCVYMLPCGGQRMKAALALIGMLVDMCTLWL